MLSFYDEVSDHVKFVRIHHHFPSFVLESNRAVRKSSHWPINYSLPRNPKVTSRKGKRAPPRKEGKTCLSSIRDDSMNREDQNKNVFKNRIFFPANGIDNYVFVGIKTRSSFSLSFSLFFLRQREKNERGTLPPI